MEYAIVFSTSTQPSQERDASKWLSSLAQDFSFLKPSGNPSWLNLGSAAEVICSPDQNLDTKNIHIHSCFMILRNAANRRNLDVNVIPIKRRRKKLLIADMDSTIITSESIDELAILAGAGEAIASITKNSMAGEIDFESALIKRVKMLKGKPSHLLKTVISKSKLTPGASELVQTMRANGAKCYLISGGFDFLSGPIAKICGFNDHHSNHMNIKNSKILGTVKTPVLDGNAKANYLDYYCEVHEINILDAVTIGDGANDLAMLKAAGLGVAYQGKSFLQDSIAVQLNHTDLRGLLYLQGFHQKDILSS